MPQDAQWKRHPRQHQGKSQALYKSYATEEEHWGTIMYSAPALSLLKDDISKVQSTYCPKSSKTRSPSVVFGKPNTVPVMYSNAIGVSNVE